MLGRGGIGGRLAALDVGQEGPEVGLEGDSCGAAAAMASRRACGGAIPEYTLIGIRRGRTIS